MLGLLEEKFSLQRYSHEYESDVPNKIFNVYKKEGGYHLYDLAVFIIVTTFLGCFFYICLSYTNPSIGYIFIVLSILGISSLI